MESNVAYGGRIFLDIPALTKFATNNLGLIFVLQTAFLIVLFIVAVNATWKLSYMRKRYRKMMTGVEGGNLERMLIGHIDETKAVSEENKRIREDLTTAEELLAKAVTRVGIVRFRAFEDMGSDLSYAVALLDSHNDGVILSSIFGREVSRSYAKPVENGTSSYTLTQEETQALKEAMGKGGGR